MIDIEVSEVIKSTCPNFVGAALIAEVSNTEHSPSLWLEIDEFCSTLKANTEIADVKNNIHIEATRKAYKALGKDPNRYRPSAEALQRRILRDLPLYQIDTLVDLINLVSLKTGYSIGGFDIEKIDGNTLTLGVGNAEERFEAIGRGLLNIEGLPIYRDNLGGIGTPTSDEERTKLSLGTHNLLMLINGYSGNQGLKEAVEYTCSLLQKHVVSKIESISYYK